MFWMNNNLLYYMVSSAGDRARWIKSYAVIGYPSGQDGALLGARDVPSRPAASRKGNFRESHILNPLLTKLVRSKWLDIGLVLFLHVYRDGVNVHKHAKKRTRPMSSHLDLTLGQYPIYQSIACNPLLSLGTSLATALFPRIIGWAKPIWLSHMNRLIPKQF